MITSAARRLPRALAGRTQQWLADLLGTKQSNVSLWLRGLSRPEPLLRTALRILFEIPEDDWFTVEEKEFLRKIEEVTLAARKSARRPPANTRVLAASARPTARKREGKAA